MKMDRKEAERYIKGQLESYLQSKGINTRSPFRCLNPAHNDKTPSMTIDRTSGSGLHCKCFGCQAYYSTLDLIGIDYGLTDTAAIFQKAYELYGIEIDGGGNKPGNQNQPKNERKTQKALHNTEYTSKESEEETDFTDFFLQAHSHIKETDYPQKRGLSQETIDRFKLGFIAEWRNPKAPKAPATPRLIIPISKYSYLARDVRAEIPKEQENYKKSKAKGKSKVNWTFNAQALRNANKPIFVVEGELDALSIIEVGGEAVALGSISYIRAFLELAKEKKPEQPLILALDNEKEPEKKERIERAYKELEEGLHGLDIPFYRFNPAGDCKDANEALQGNREALRQAVEEATEEIEQERKAKEEAERKEYLQTSTAYSIQTFMYDIEKSKTAVYYSTRFSNVDGLLDGGLFSGLYVVGAISSLGKTTFCLQIMDNIAAAGHDVIIFSLEMARSELIAKSVSRHSLQADIKKYRTTTHAKTVRGITTGTRYRNYSQKDREIIEAAIADYSKYAHHIYVHEGVGNIGVERIREVVEQHIKITGNKPVILIDYVQILAPYNERATDKQNTDKNVLELKRLSRDFSIPVIGISSFNRDNYTAPVNMAAFKESGAVEYSSDVLIALQYDGMDYQPNEKDGDRQKRVRDLMNEQTEKAKSGKAQSIQVKVLKNRNGSRGDALLEFYPMFNFFTERGKSGIAGTAGEDAGEWTTIASTGKTEARRTRR